MLATYLIHVVERGKKRGVRATRAKVDNIYSHGKSVKKDYIAINMAFVRLGSWWDKSLQADDL
jgi:hypothetical protein